MIILLIDLVCVLLIDFSSSLSLSLEDELEDDFLLLAKIVKDMINYLTLRHSYL